MTPGTQITIDGRPFVVKSVDKYGYTVQAPKGRAVKLWRDGGGWRYGRDGEEGHGDSMKPINILKKARATLSNPENWIQDEYATDDLGFGVSPKSPRAVCWCAIGAIIKASRKADREAAFDLLKDAIGYISIHTWNDDSDRTHDEVLAAFDKAIGLAGER